MDWAGWHVPGAIPLLIVLVLVYLLFQDSAGPRKPPTGKAPRIGAQVRRTAKAKTSDWPR